MTDHHRQRSKFYFVHLMLNSPPSDIPALSTCESIQHTIVDTMMMKMVIGVWFSSDFHKQTNASKYILRIKVIFPFQIAPASVILLYAH